MKYKTRLFVFCLSCFLTVGCNICPGQMFIASGVNGNGCCDNKTVVIVGEDATGQNTNVDLPGSGSPTASPTVSPSVSPSPSPTPVPTAIPTATPTASPTVYAGPEITPNPEAIQDLRPLPGVAIAG